MTESNKPNLSVRLGEINLKNPIVMCSGTFANGLEYSNFYDISELGAITTKSYSLKCKDGNKPPRIWETACGVLNSIGLQNDGIESFINDHLPKIKDMNADIILSLFGESCEEFRELALAVKKIKTNILAVELNLSCPNVEKGGMIFCSMPEVVEKITISVKEILNIPVIVKLSPNTGDTIMIESAKRAKNGGAEAISLINTLVGTAVDIENIKPRLGNVLGGLSGPAIKPIALAKVYTLSNENILPMIGMGGICTWNDAVEFLLMGANAIGIGTANFVEYCVGLKIIKGVSDYLESKDIDDVNKIIGKLSNKQIIK